MAWTVYRWDDLGAPVLKATDSALVLLLDAVLVGAGGVAYGSKPSAGWAGTYLSDTSRAYTNAGTGKKLKVTHPASSSYASVVGVDGDTEAGPFFPTTTQVAAGLSWIVSNSNDATGRPWIIAADNKRFYLWVGYNLTTGHALSASTDLKPFHFAGDILSYKGIDANHFMVIGGQGITASVQTAAGCQSAVNQSALSGHYICRSHTQTGTSVQVGKMADYPLAQTTISGAVTAFTYPDPVSGGMVLSPIRVYEPNIYGPRGVLPGLWFVHHNLPGNNGDTFSGAAGGPLGGKSFILLDATHSGSRGRLALETSDTIGF